MRENGYELYQNFVIKYYILVDPAVESIKAYLFIEEKEYDMMQKDLNFNLKGECSISPDFSELWN